MRRRIGITDGELTVHGASQRVRGAKYISAILLVNLATPISSPYEKDLGKKARIDLFVNHHAAVPIDQALERELLELPIGSVEFGPGWESWEGMERAGNIERCKRLGGSMEHYVSGDGTLGVELPTSLVLRILSGQENAKRAFAESYGDQYPASLFRDALASNRDLVECSISNDESASRSEPTILFKFGPPQETVVSQAKGNQ